MTHQTISTTTTTMVAMLVSISAIMESAQANPVWVPIQKRAEPAEESKKAEESKAEPKASEHPKEAKPSASHEQKATSAAAKPSEPKETSKPKASESHKEAASTTKKASSSSHTPDKKKEADSSESAKASNNNFSFNGVSPIAPSQNNAPTSSPTGNTQFVDQGNQKDQSSGMSGGAIAGVIIAIIVGIGAIAGFFLVRRRRKEAERNKLRMKPDPFTMGFGSHDPPGTATTGGDFNQATNNYPPHTAYNMANQSPMIQLPPIGASAPQPQQPSPMMQTPVMTNSPALNQYNAEVSQYHNTGNADYPMNSTSPISGPGEAAMMGGAIAGGAAMGVAAATAVNNNNNNSSSFQEQQQQQQQQPVAEATTEPDVTPSLGVFPVVSTYTPTLSDELDIQPGDRVEVLTEYDDGWCQGINLSRGNCKGVFPKHCVDMYTDSNKQAAPTLSGSDQPNYLDASGMKRVSSMLGQKQQQSSPYYL